MGLKFDSVFKEASGGQGTVPADWLPASRIRPLIYGDPSLLWFDFHGAQHGFTPDSTPYDFLGFISRKRRQFTAKWIREKTPGAIKICQQPYEATFADLFQDTLRQMTMGVPVLVNPALWWAPEGIYGMPNLIIHSTWLHSYFPKSIGEDEAKQNAPNLMDNNLEGHYLVLDIRYIGKLDLAKPVGKLYAMQAHICSHIVGKLQGYMPEQVYLVTREKPDSLEAVTVSDTFEKPLDEEVRHLRDQFIEIKLKGAGYTPWHHEQVACNFENAEDAPWGTAKKKIAAERLGGDPGQIYNIGRECREMLNQAGFSCIKDLLEVDPQDLPLEKCKGIGDKRAARIRALLKANRENRAVLPLPAAMPKPKRFEFYVDFEFFNDLNVDFDAQWPALNGREMIFMIGVGWEENGGWRFEYFLAEDQTLVAEGEIFAAFIAFLKSKAGSAYKDSSQTAIYHWTTAERTQTQNAAKRLGMVGGSGLTDLPWVDLQKVFLDGYAALPGMWKFGLKEVAAALTALDSQYDPLWLGDLEGLGAMVLGWDYYEGGSKGRSDKLAVLRQYLQADCKALWQILRWLRSGAALSLPAGGSEANEAIKDILYARKNDGKGVHMYLQPVLGKTKGIIVVQHLIWGDELRVLKTQQDWYKVFSRNTTGWIHKSMTQPERLLEVNFVDVGQGDGSFIITPDNKYWLVDAGLDDNMVRFIRWRFGNFRSKVNFEAMIVSHPDEDHYDGFTHFFDPKDPAMQNVTFDNLYHNGILYGEKEGDYVKEKDTFDTLEDIDYELTVHGRRHYHKLLNAVRESKRVKNIRKLWADPSGSMTYVAGYDETNRTSAGKPFYVEVLGPVPDTVTASPRLRWLKDKGQTKNGHSVILRMVYDKVTLLLGGDLNSEAENHLLEHYEERKGVFRSDVAKSCHHGSADFTNRFLEEVDAIATVVSSGDNEPHGHPRPESIGALGHYGRGQRPLVFSTELARSTEEKIKNRYQLRMNLLQARLKDDESQFIDDLIVWLDRSVAVYGMITVRTDGDEVLIAQKLERARSVGQKWDLHLLQRDDQGDLRYIP